MSTNDTKDELRSGIADGSAAISEEEFCRLQDQLIALRNCNYELLEENRRQQNYINALSSKDTETLLVSKLVGRKKEKDNINDKLENEIHLLQRKLLSQEEEFRLQQSTLLSELNKVVRQCELLEEKSNGRDESIHSEDLAALVQNKDDIEKLVKKNLDLEMEVSALRGMLTEKDSLATEMKVLNQDLLSAKKILDEEIIMEQQRSASLNRELSEFVRRINEYDVLLHKKDEELAVLRTSIDLVNKPSTHEKLTQTNDLEDTEELKVRVRYLEEKCRSLSEIEKVASEKDALLKEEQKMRQSLEVDLQTAKGVAEVEKGQRLKEKETWVLEKKKLQNKLQTANLQYEELLRCREEQTLAAQNFENIKVALEAKIKDADEERKKKDEEMKVALKKQSSMVKELRRQVQSEKKRAEQAEKHLDEVLCMNDASLCQQNGTRMRMGGSPSTLSDRCRFKSDAEAASSICSWAFVAEPDKNSLHNFDGEESSCSASILETDNAELISRLAVLQKKHAETLDRLNMVEEENALLRKEVNEKSEVIAQWIRSLPDSNHSVQLGVSSPGRRFRRMLEMVRVDESAADIRDMNRRLQRMLEETLSKNLVLQKNIQTLLEKNDK